MPMDYLMEYQGNPWDRQPDETSKSFECFLFYRNLDPSERSILKAYKQYKKDSKITGNKPPVYVSRWSSEYNWVDRVKHWDDYQDRLYQQELIELRKEDKETRIKTLRGLRGIVARYMQVYNPEQYDNLSGRELAYLIKTLHDEMRLELGETEESLAEDNYNQVIITLPDNGRD